MLSSRSGGRAAVCNGGQFHLRLTAPHPGRQVVVVGRVLQLVGGGNVRHGTDVIRREDGAQLAVQVVGVAHRPLLHCGHGRGEVDLVLRRQGDVSAPAAGEHNVTPRRNSRTAGSGQLLQLVLSQLLQSLSVGIGVRRLPGRNLSLRGGLLPLPGIRVPPGPHQSHSPGMRAQDGRRCVNQGLAIPELVVHHLVPPGQHQGLVLIAGINYALVFIAHFQIPPIKSSSSYYPSFR